MDEVEYLGALQCEEKWNIVICRKGNLVKVYIFLSKQFQLYFYITQSKINKDYLVSGIKN